MSILHVFNGDSAAVSFRELNPDADVLVSRDAVCAGPAPAQFGAGWIDARARFLADTYAADPDGCRADLEATEKSLAALNRYDEVMLWYGNDLFCLVVMLSHAARLAAAELGSTQIAIVCPDGRSRTPAFSCLGELPPAPLAELMDEKVPVDAAWIASAAEAWGAYTSLDPTAVNARSADPLLRRSLKLHAARFPDTRSGLGCIEQELLRRLEHSQASFAELFRDHGEKLSDYGWGDLQLRDDVQALIDRERPLVALEAGVYAITEAGRAALAGDPALGLAERGKRFLGGVALRRGHPWRYDARAEQIIRAA